MHGGKGGRTGQGRVTMTNTQVIARYGVNAASVRDDHTLYMQ